MPIKIQKDLPAKAILESENIFVMDEDRAMSQDIRPLEILILNLMPIKEDTETQLLRALSNTPLQVDCSFLMLETHVSKNTSQTHLNKFYVTFDEIRRKRFDGMIITGAPVENMEFEEINYWDELTKIMEWSKTPRRFISAGACRRDSIIIMEFRNIRERQSFPAFTDIVF